MTFDTVVGTSSVDLELALPLNKMKRSTKSHLIFKWVDGALKRITIRRPLLAGDRASKIHCKLCMTLLDFADSKSFSADPRSSADRTGEN